MSHGEEPGTEDVSHETSESRRQEGGVTKEMVVTFVFFALAAVVVAVLCLLYPSA